MYLKKIHLLFEQNLTPDCIIYGFGYTFQFSQMTKSTQVPSWVLFLIFNVNVNEIKKEMLRFVKNPIQIVFSL